MQDSERVLPLWFERFVAFAFVAVAGTLATAFCGWLMLVLGVGGDAAFAAIFEYFGVMQAFAIGCGIAMALAAVSNRRRAFDARRVLVAATVLFVVGVGALLAPAAVVASWDFDAAAFREARAAQDDDTLERQAHLAVDDEALIGKSRDDLRALLGAPDRVGKRRRLWIYDVGFINDLLGPGDGGYLYVRFDDGWRRVVDARVGSSY